MKKIMPYAGRLMLTLIFSLLVSGSRAQVMNAIQTGYDQSVQSTLQEKLFIHTDKDTYLPGEILWFKVYCVDGSDHQPLDVSKVAYIEILDQNKQPVVQAKVSLKNGSGSGSLYIPVSVGNGNYQLRAYTNWMKNFSPDFYFAKKITVINPLKSPGQPLIAAALTYNIQFFPEGGSLVSGLNSKVGFKALDNHGNGVAVTGVLLNDQNDTVARFHSYKFGMGNFSFTPTTDGLYKALVKVSGGRSAVSAFPQISKNGYVMKLKDDHSGQLDVALTSLSSPEGDIYLFAHSGQATKVALQGRMTKGTVHFTINKALLAEGITHLTLFNASRQPICERLYFKRPLHKMSIAATTDQTQYGIRKKVNIIVKAQNQSGITIGADLSVAVYRVDSLQGIDPTSIVNYLWLGADLKGNIESPDFYFNTSDTEADQALDNLMLTQGWRRFQWNNILPKKAESFRFLPEYHDHVVTAKIFNTITGVPAKDVLTYLAIPGKRVQLYTALSDSSGSLSYHLKDFYGSGELIVQTNPLIDSTYRIELLSPFSEESSSTALPSFHLPVASLKALEEHSLGIQVLNIYSGNSTRRFYDPVVDSAAFYGKPRNTYKLDDFTRFTTMEEDLREYVKEDNIVRTKGKFHIKVLSGNGFLESDPLVLLDGIPVFNIDKVMTIDPLKVRKLDVLPSLYYYGPSVEQGIFSFTTYKGDLGGVELDTHALVVDYEGLQLRREFYSPVYDTSAKTASRIPDFRNLLYWNPSVGKLSEAELSFYTSDAPGKYIGVVQGINAAGDAASQQFTFEVR